MAGREKERGKRLLEGVQVGKENYDKNQKYCRKRYDAGHETEKRKQHCGFFPQVCIICFLLIF